jgi:hypothetical protein
MRPLLLPLLIVTLTLIAFSQNPAQTSSPGNTAWVRLEGPNADVAIDLPSKKYAVDKAETVTKVIYSDQQVYVRLDHSEEAIKQKNLIKAAENEIGRYGKGNLQKTKVVDRTDHVIGEYTDDDELTGIKTTRLTIVSVYGKYTITVRSTKDPNSERDRILSSIRLGDSSLYRGMGDRADVAETINVRSLKTSEDVKSALNKPDSNQAKLVWVKDDSGARTAVEYLRPAVILRKPHGSYTDEARRNNAIGTVRLRVTLRSDGTVGDIQCLEKWNWDLEMQSFQAAKQIKFLPAEIDGKPVDSKLVMEYGYSIY